MVNEGMGEASAADSKGYVVLVDPYSTGCAIAKEIVGRGYLVIALWTKETSEEVKKARPSSCKGLVHAADLTEEATLEDTAKGVRAIAGERLAAVICGGDSGVTLADALSEHLSLRTNGTGIPHRRDKKVQQELVKAKGLRSVRQAGGKTLADVEAFLDSEPMPVVVKPCESAGSDGVKLCYSKAEAVEHFELLMRAQRRVGTQDAAVLCQEFLKGKEYVVDHVSVDGVHKTVMIFVYDRRPLNGSAFVYHGMIPVPADSREAQVLIPYVRGVLDALEIKNGPTHGEVMITADGPCLVEMNCRAHGLDGLFVPIGKALTGGYSQVNAAADAFLDVPSWEKLPDVFCAPFKAAGQAVRFVSVAEGTVTSTPGYDAVRQMPSLVHLEASKKPGDSLERTVDLFQNLGHCILVHQDPEVVQRDVEAIRKMEQESTFFTLEEQPVLLLRPRADSEGDLQLRLKARSYSNDDLGAPSPAVARALSRKTPVAVGAGPEYVIIVDPYSTGCCLAQMAFDRGYRVIAVWSKTVSDELKKHVPQSCERLQYVAEIAEAATLAGTAAAALAIASAGKAQKAQKAAGFFTEEDEGCCSGRPPKPKAAAGQDAADGVPGKIVACIVGGESGVSLADALSEYMKLLTNGTQIPQRRDKKIQQELVKAAGLRSVRQAGGRTLAEVDEFLKMEQYPIVVKPVESAGSDGVKLCHSYEEATEHFDLLIHSQARLVGAQGAAVLCQEFLKGKEYVVDHVSRDGVHKTVMIWVYDKRSVNGAAFVYHGCLPVPLDSYVAKIVVPYVRGVLDALQIRNGPSHGEVMMTVDGPCLVEMNCRAHGGDGACMPLAEALTGYSQVDATLDCFLDEAVFNKLPDVPPCPYLASGQEVLLVSFSKGTVKEMPGFEMIKMLDSFVSLETCVREGSEVTYTVDLSSNVGSAILRHHDTAVVERDVDTIRKLERNNDLFTYQRHVEILGRPRADSAELKTVEDLAAQPRSSCSVM